MPAIQLGVYLTSGRETENAVKHALEVRTEQHKMPHIR
jgi:hypothetical protein